MQQSMKMFNTEFDADAVGLNALFHHYAFSYLAGVFVTRNVFGMEK